MKLFFWRNADQAKKKRISWILFFILLIMRIFYVEHYMVPSSSMTPTLLTGDIIFIKKYSFAWRRLSIPFGGYLPFFKRGYEFGKPKHGDMAVFVLYDRDPATYYVKRVIGLPGDYVQMKNGVLHINDKPCKMELIGNFKFMNDDGKVEIGQKYKVTMPFPPFKSYYVYRNEPFGAGHIDNTPRFKVPDEHVWVQGDFNTGSEDSFNPHFMGPVKMDSLVGKPFFVLYGSDSRLTTEPDWIRWLVQLPWRILYCLIKTNFNRFCVFVS